MLQTSSIGRVTLKLDLVPPGKAAYLHVGQVIDGVDMRAEVGLLSRNVVVMGEMEGRCYEYGSKLCSFFDFDTFGGHIKVGLLPSPCTSLHHTLTYRGSQDAGREASIPSLGAADPPHCCCLVSGFEVYLTPLQTLLSHAGWCSTPPRDSLRIPIPVLPKFCWCAAQGGQFEPR